MSAWWVHCGASMNRFKLIALCFLDGLHDRRAPNDPPIDQPRPEHRYGNAHRRRRRSALVRARRVCRVRPTTRSSASRGRP